MRTMKKEWHVHYGESWSNGVRDWVAAKETGGVGIEIKGTGSCTPFTLCYVYHCTIRNLYQGNRENQEELGIRIEIKGTGSCT